MSGVVAMKRSVLLTLLRTAGYHGDRTGFTRLLIEGRITMDKAQRAYREGEAAKLAGVTCDCRECSHG